MAARSYQRLGLLVATGFLVFLSLVFLESRKSGAFGKQDAAPSAQPSSPSSPLQNVESATDSAPNSSSAVHPIASLVDDAEKQFSQRLERQSKTLKDAVNEYRRRYNMNPPPHFDKWFKYAQSKGVELIDEYDTIYHSLLPFWGLSPHTIRARAREALGGGNGLYGVLIRNGRVSLIEGLVENDWRDPATRGMLEDFVKYLPDMDLAFNVHDEPRVILPNDDLQRLVSIAKDHVIPRAFATQSAVNAWSARPPDVNKGDRIDGVRTSRFNTMSRQPAWIESRMSCPADSPVRSLDENPPDDTTGYALTELGFIQNTTAFSDVCSTPSLRDMFAFFDRPNTFDVVHDLFPIFSQSKVSTFQDILYPSPWYWDKRVDYVQTEDYGWEEKIDKLYWRGSTTGGWAVNGGWRRQHRQVMVGNINSLGKVKVLAKKDNGHWESKEVDRRNYKDLFDVHFTFIQQCDEHDCAAQTEFFELAPQEEQKGAWSYKYLVDIDGNAFSGRYHAFLKSNSLIFKVSMFREWHDERLVPWLHYMPMSLKGDEFVETMRYFISEEEGKVAAPRLAQKGKDWAQRTLRNEDMEVWFFRLLLEYGRLIDDNRENLGFFV